MIYQKVIVLKFENRTKKSGPPQPTLPTKLNKTLN